MRKIFFSDLSCAHGRTCVYGRYAPVITNRCFALFSIMRDQVEQLKRPGFSAATKGIGKESDENEEKLLSLFAKLFSEALRAGFPNYG